MGDDLRNLIVGIMLFTAAAVAFVAGDTSDVITGDPTSTPQPSPVAACNPGWEDVSVNTEHAVVFACMQESIGADGKPQKWLVVLNTDGSFNHGHQDDTPGAQFIYDPALVPGWLQ